MPVEDWARREAARRYPTSRFSSAESHRETQVHQADMQAGIVHAFSAFLSDEAVVAAQGLLAERGMWIALNNLHDALQAAISAVTEGDTE